MKLSSIFSSKIRQFVWKRRCEGLNKENVIPTVKHSKSVMMWGCVAGPGVGHLLEIPVKMNAKVYVNDILSQHLNSSANELGIGDNYVFQADNDPKHTSKLAKKWLADQLVETLEWPPQSPDLNVIENLWDEIDTQMPKTSRKSFKTFKESIHTIWKNMSTDIINNLIESIPRRLKAVIDAKGYNTRY